jgi:hypothetical protein
VDDLVRRRDAATAGYLVGSKFFGEAAEGLRGWSVATLQRQQQRTTARSEPALTATLQLTERDWERLREEAAHRRQTLTEAVRQWPIGRGSAGERRTAVPHPLQQTVRLAQLGVPRGAIRPPECTAWDGVRAAPRPAL